MPRFLIHYRRKRLFFPISDVVVVAGCGDAFRAEEFAKNKISGRLVANSISEVDETNEEEIAEASRYHQIMHM